MRISVGLVEKLIRLRGGESLPASSLKGEWVEELLKEEVLVSFSRGTHRTVRARSAEELQIALSALDERLADLEGIRKMLLSGEVSRAEQASETGNSKLVTARACPGFPVNSYEPIGCTLHGASFVVSPPEGSFSFVSDWREFSVPSDVTIIGIENMENFRMIRSERSLFRKTLGERKLLFVSRYPQSGDLVSFLQSIPNPYVHFGDFDLAGIHIFLSEFEARLGKRSSFLIPSDIEERIAHGSRERYQLQYRRFGRLRTDIPALQALIDLIHKYHRCYDQEGYIER